MKKILLSTSAIVGVGLLAMPAMAQAKRVQLAVGGYMEQYVGYADADRKKTASFDLAKWDQQSDTEVFFRGSTKLDNGITMSVVIELEGDASAGGANSIIDESYLRVVSPTLGELRLGADDAVDGIMNVQAARGISGDYDNWVTEAGLTKNDNLYDNASGDTNKVSYFTPKIAGFQAGVSFANTSTQSSVDLPNYTGAVGGPVWAAAATYETKLADVGVKLGVNTSKQSSSRLAVGRTNYAGGAQLRFQGFMLSGGYAKTEQNINATAATASRDGDRYMIGLQYATGPYTVGVWHMNDKNKGIANIPGNDTTKAYTAYADYVLSDGVKLQGFVFNVDYKHEVDVAANQNGGWGVVTGFRLDF